MMPQPNSDRLKAARALRHGYPPWFLPEIADRVLEACTFEVDADVAKECFMQCRVVTGIGREAYRSFIVDKKYLTFWQTGPTWHKKFHPDPVQGRQFNDLRLFGARAENTVFAMLIQEGPVFSGLPYGTKEDLLDYLTNYAHNGKVLEWYDDVLDNATFTYGDSQQNIIAFDFDPEALWGYCLAMQFTLCFRNGEEDLGSPFFNKLRESLLTQWSEDQITPVLSASFLGCGMERNPYFEIQLHSGVVPDDMKRIYV